MLRVLLVDDHVDYRRLLARLLASGGFEIVGEAGTGQEAIDQARRLAPDLVLLDVQLPDLNGFEVAKRLANSPAGPVIVVISSRQRDEFGPLADALLCKFLSKDELSVERLNRLLSEG